MQTVDSITPRETAQSMRRTAAAMDLDAGRLDIRGQYQKACNLIRLAAVLRELADTVDAWDRTQTREGAV